MSELIDQVWPLFCAVYKWIYGWQTLIAALIALAAAFWTIKVMRLQMTAETNRHHETQRRKQLAARAQMPDALSELSAYVRASSSRLLGITDILPPEPTSAITTLKGVIEFIDDKAAGRAFELVSWYQVFRARSTHDVPVRAGVERRDRLYDAVLLQAYINSLFDYGRNEINDVEFEKPSLEEMTDALKNSCTLMHIVQNEAFYNDVKELIARRHERSDTRH